MGIEGVSHAKGSQLSLFIGLGGIQPCPRIEGNKGKQDETEN